MMHHPTSAGPMVGVWTLSLLTLVIAASANAEPPTAANAAREEAARRLVEQLGDDQFAVREQATDQLLRLGLPASTALLDGSRHLDREVRYRCERILLLIKQLDFDQRLELFLRDAGSGKGAELPGWDTFRGDYGDSIDSRRLFVDMQRAEPELMAAIDRGQRFALDTLFNRTQEFQRALQGQISEVPVGSSAAMLFLAVWAGAESNPQTGSQVYQFCYHNSFRNAITSGPSKDLLRKLLGRWISRGDENLGYQGMMLALQYDLKEGLTPAEKWLRNPNSQPYMRQYAVLAVARLGNAEHWPLVEAALSDERSVGTWQINNVNINTQVRDVALAALVHLTKQNAKDYGFDRLQANQPFLFNPITAGFESAEARNKALKKWQDYRDNELKKKEQ